MAGKLTAEAERVLRENLASFDAEVAFELENEGERADLWTDIDVPVEALRALLDELSRLREALKPFAAAKGYFDGYVRDEDTVSDSLRHIRAHHVRAAARALSKREGQE